MNTRITQQKIVCWVAVQGDEQMAKVTVCGAMGEPLFQADDWGGCPDPYLADLLKKAERRKMSPAEKRAQRISFIYGQTGVDKDRISEVLDGQ